MAEEVPFEPGLVSEFHAVVDGRRISAAGLLAAISSARRESAGVALDDLGSDPSSLAVMPLVRPDVIKYDLDVLKHQSSPRTSRIITSVLAEAEVTGATVLTEGVESPRGVVTAKAMGAALAQGWHFGRPGPLPMQFVEPAHPIRFLPLPPTTGLSPFEILFRERHSSRTTKELLIPISMHLEERILSMDDPAVVLACFQDARHFDAATARRYQALAERTTLVAALGRDMPPEPAPQVRGGRLDPDDPLGRQWIVIAIGTHYAVALLALDRGDAVAEHDRSFDFVITHDRRLVIQAAQHLLPQP